MVYYACMVGFWWYLKLVYRFFGDKKEIIDKIFRDMFINCFVVVKFWFINNVFEKILLNIFVDSKNSTLFVGYF